jgi:mono/diheme cytochrome c family protein
MKKILLIMLGVFTAGFLLIQLIPYGRGHTNPPVIAEPPWDSLQTRASFMQVCGDCHSNETIWPWYSHVAPVSWLIQHDVEEGREYLNVSEWGTREFEAEEAAEVYKEGEMPPLQYYPTHPEACLSAADRSDFMQGLITTFGYENEHDAGDDD